MKKIYSPKKWLLCLSTLFVSAAAANAQGILEEWSFATSAAPTTVGSGVVGTTPTMSHLFTSTFTPGDPDSPAAYTAYYGEAFSANDGATGGYAGDGVWSHSAPYDGPGSKLYLAQQGAMYQQFVLTASTDTLYVDAVTFNSGFLNTSSGTALAIQYSHSNFVSDSDTLCSPNSSISDSLLIPKETGATVPAALASFSITPCSVITVNPGTSVTWRLYWACGSSSVDRFGFLQNFAFQGTRSGSTAGVANVQQHAAIAIYPNPATDNITVTGTEQNDIISITNVLGKEVARYNCNGGSESIATSSLSPALYIVRVLSADGTQVSVQKLTKN